ncbi:MAG: hypothetical protein Fur0034_19110 [Desulfuromonadia bacterium]
MRSIVLFAVLLLFAAPLHGADGEGKRLFDRFCNGCHYQGGNIVRKDKPLTRLHRAANGFDSVEAIVRKIRGGGNGMPRYGSDQISEPDARKIAAYIIETFD